MHWLEHLPSPLFDVGPGHNIITDINKCRDALVGSKAVFPSVGRTPQKGSLNIFGKGGKNILILYFFRT